MSFSKKQLVNGLLLLAFLVATAYFLKLYVWNEQFSPEYIKQAFESHPISVTVGFILVSAMATMIGLPRQAVAFAAGYCFDFLGGILLSTLAASLGCILCFYSARYLAFNYIQNKHAKRIVHINQFLASDPLVKTLIIRLLPLGSNLITNLVAGVTKIQARKFFIGSSLGYLPQMTIFSLSGSGISLESTSRIVVSIALFFICIVLSAWLYRKYKHTDYVVRSS